MDQNKRDEMDLGDGRNNQGEVVVTKNSPWLIAATSALAIGVLALGAILLVRDKPAPAVAQAMESRIQQLEATAASLKKATADTQPAAAATVVAPAPKVEPIPAPVAKKTAAATNPGSGPFGLIIGRIYTKEQRAIIKTENLPALEACSKIGSKLSLCFKETGNKKKARFETQVLAVTDEGMLAAEMQAVKQCLHDNLPKILKRDGNGAIVTGDDGKQSYMKIVPDQVAMSTYTAEQPCLNE